MTDTNSNENEIPITAEDIREFDFEEILSQPAKSIFGSLKQRTCINYKHRFVERGKVAEADNDIKSKAICELFGLLCSLGFRLDSNDTYVMPYTGQSFGLAEPYQAILLNTVEDFDDPELQARVADVLWFLRVGNYQVAMSAVKAYLESAKLLEDPKEWVDCANRIERALQIASQLGQSNPLYHDVISYIEALLNRLNGEDPLFLSYRMMRLLLDKGEGDPSKYVALSEKLAKKSEANLNWDRARAYWEIQALWYTKLQNDTEVDNSRLRAAKTYIYQADDYINATKPNYRHAVHELRFAVEALRQIRAPQKLITETHAKLLDCQNKDNDFKTASFSIDIQEIVERSVEAVKGKSLQEAVFTLATLIEIPQVDEMETQVENLIKHHSFHFWMMSYQLDEKGRVITQRPALDLDDEQHNQGVVRATMFQESTRYHELVALGAILPALNQINLDHHVRVQDLEHLVIHNPFVPPQHEMFYIRGLHFGFQRDFLVASHLLVPQIEQSIRYLLEQRGVITSKLDSQGVQDVFALNKLLYEVPEVEDIFGTDTLFALQGLLVNRFGSNFRNLLAHGRLTSYNAQSLRSVYIWGLVLRILCTPILNNMTHIESNSDDPNQ